MGSSSGYPIPVGNMEWFKSELRKLDDRLAEVGRTARAAAVVAAFPTRLELTGASIGDANDAIYDGWYRGANILNSPNGVGWWYIEVMAHDASSWRVQHAYGYTDVGNGQTWRRHEQNGVWQAWTRLYVTDAEQRAKAAAAYATAAGVSTSTATAGSSTAPIYWNADTAVDFPVGRFSVPPIVNVSALSAGSVVWAQLTVNATTTGFSYRVMRVGATPAATAVHWQATQMTATTAAG